MPGLLISASVSAMRAALSGESVERAMTPPDILIVGAGAAGLSLATALGREGFCVTVIDGAQRPKPPRPIGVLQIGTCVSAH